MRTKIANEEAMFYEELLKKESIQIVRNMARNH